MQGFLSRSFSMNTGPVTLSAPELLLLFHCLGEVNEIFLPNPSSAQDPKLPRKKKEVSNSKLSVIRITLHAY